MIVKKKNSRFCHHPSYKRVNKYLLKCKLCGKKKKSSRFKNLGSLK